MALTTVWHFKGKQHETFGNWRDWKIVNSSFCYPRTTAWVLACAKKPKSCVPHKEMAQRQYKCIFYIGIRFVVLFHIIIIPIFAQCYHRLYVILFPQCTYKVCSFILVSLNKHVTGFFYFNRDRVLILVSDWFLSPMNFKRQPLLLLNNLYK